MVSAAREARYIPGGIRKTSRRVDRTGRALVEPAKAKIAQRTLRCFNDCGMYAAQWPVSRSSATCWHGRELYGRETAVAVRMSPYSINDPSHWLDRAKEARAPAEQIDEPEAKRTMRKNADDYERHAKRAEERAAGRWPQSK
jgi:hypothetical protein